MSSDPTTAPLRGAAFTWAALLVSIVAAAGSVWLSVGMKLNACPLCFYQRTFAFAAVCVYAVGLLAGAERRVALSLLALPLAVGGAGVAAFHVWLVENGTLECPLGVFGLYTAPHQSLAVFALLLLVQVCDLTGRLPSGQERLAAVAGLALGALFAWGSIASSPPSPDPPKGGWPDKEIKVCRKPYRAP
jgi:disulfide bond formation protein DsbB